MTYGTIVQKVLTKVPDTFLTKVPDTFFSVAAVKSTIAVIALSILTVGCKIGTSSGVFGDGPAMGGSSTTTINNNSSGGGGGGGGATPTPTATPTPSPTPYLTKISGDPQSAPTGTQFSTPIIVYARDANNLPVQNHAVIFGVSGAGAGTLSASVVNTDVNGLAQVMVTAGVSTGAVTVTANSAYGSLTFSLTTVAFASYSISQVQNAAATDIGTVATNTLKVWVKDSGGIPAPNILVQFAVSSNNPALGGAAIGGGASVLVSSDINGYAETSVRVGTTGGNNTVLASLLREPSTQTTFTFVGTVPSNSAVDLSRSLISLSTSTIAANGSNQVTATILVKDQYGNLIPNNTQTVSASFSPSDLGVWQSSSAFTYSTTGTYVNTFVVGSTVGTATFTGSINGNNLTSGTVPLALTFTAIDYSAYTITAVPGGSGQTGYINATLNPFIVEIRRGNGTVAPGVRVVFQCISNCGTFPASASSTYDNTTGSGGQVSAIYRFGVTPGVSTIRAQVQDYPSKTVDFTVTASIDPTSPISLSQTAVTLSSASIAAGETPSAETTVSITLKDQYGNTIPNASAVVTVTPSVTNLGLWFGGASGATTLTAGTGVSAGVYSRKFIAGSISGTVTFSATIASATTIPALTTTALSSTAATLVVTANATASVLNTTISASGGDLSGGALVADGLKTTTINVSLVDASGNPITSAGYTVLLSANVGTLVGGNTMTYNAGTGTYQKTFRAPTSSGTNAIVSLVSINGVSTALSTTITLNPGPASASRSYLAISGTGNLITPLGATGTAGIRTLTIYVRDQYDNPIPTTTLGCALTAGGITLTKETIPADVALGTFTPIGFKNTAGGSVITVPVAGAAGTCTAIIQAPTACGGAGGCFETVTAQIPVNGVPTAITNSGMRIQYSGTSWTPSAANSIYTVSSTSVMTGQSIAITITPRNSLNAASAVGGYSTWFTAALTNGTLSSVTDNNDGTYSVTALSPVSSGQGTFSVALTASPFTAFATANSTFQYMGAMSLATSSMSLASNSINGPTSTTVYLYLKDSSGNAVTNLTLAPNVADIRFATSNANTTLSGSITQSGGLGSPIYYQQTIGRNASPEIDFETTGLTAQYYNGSVWQNFALGTTLTINPVNLVTALAGAPLDCTNLATYRGKNLYISGGTVTINSRVNNVIDTSGGCSGFGAEHPFRFGNIKIDTGATLTHTAGTASTIYGLDIESTGTITNLGSINVDSRGYVAGYGSGGSATTPPTNSAHGGAVPGTASHGGTGLGPINSTYDSISDPVFPGVGGSSVVANCSGGGVIRLKAVSVVNNGSISANAQMAGAAGSIKIEVSGSLSGNGSFQARTTASFNWSATERAGGGGRIAVIGSMSGVTLSQFNVSRFSGLSLNNYLGNGTLYFDTALTGTLTIPHHLWLCPIYSVNVRNCSVLPMTSATDLVIPSGVTLTLDATTASPLTIKSLDVQAGGVLNHSRYNSTYFVHGLNVSAIGPIAVSGIVSASALGYAPSFGRNGTSGCTSGYCTANTTVGAGGSHSAIGGLNPGTFTWGSTNAPTTAGGGGVGAGTVPTNPGYNELNQTSGAGVGGGQIYLKTTSAVTGDITVNGSVSASGGTAYYISGTGAGGGGAGGSVYISAKTTLAGVGSLNAVGASASGAGVVNAGGGAGGMIRAESNGGSGVSTVNYTAGSGFGAGGAAGVVGFFTTGTPP
jgi:hypothetical protein